MSLRRRGGTGTCQSRVRVPHLSPVAHAWHGSSKRGASDTCAPIHAIETQGWHRTLPRQRPSDTPKPHGSRAALDLGARWPVTRVSQCMSMRRRGGTGTCQSRVRVPHLSPVAHAWHGSSKRGASDTCAPIHAIETQGWHRTLPRQRPSDTPKPHGSRAALDLGERWPVRRISRFIFVGRRGGARTCASRVPVPHLSLTARAWHGSSKRGASDTRAPLHAHETQGWPGALPRQRPRNTPKPQGSRAALALGARWPVKRVSRRQTMGRTGGTGTRASRFPVPTYVPRRTRGTGPRPRGQ